MPKNGSKIAEIANILREIAGKLPKIANFSKSRVFGGAGAHHVGSQRVNSNRGCVGDVRLRDY